MSELILYEVFVRAQSTVGHQHVGSLRGASDQEALQLARDLYTRRNEGKSLWVVRSSDIIASDPAENKLMFEPAKDKMYRHSSFYHVPLGVDNL